MSRKFWKGDIIKELRYNEVFVFGANPQGLHGAGAAKCALDFGAKMGTGRGLMGQSYGLITKNLEAGFREFDKNNFEHIYRKEGPCSVSLVSIHRNIQELYETALKLPQLNFIITYKIGVSLLCGWTDEEIAGCFLRHPSIPDNIIFHDSYKKFFTED